MVFIQYDFETLCIERVCSFPLNRQVCDFSGFGTVGLLRLGHKRGKDPTACIGTLVFGGLGHYVRRARPSCWVTLRGLRWVFWPMDSDKSLGTAASAAGHVSEDTSKWVLRPPVCDLQPLSLASWGHREETETSCSMVPFLKSWPTGSLNRIKWLF